MTARKQSRATLRESEARYRDALGALLDPVAILQAVRDGSGAIVDETIVYANAALLRQLGRAQPGDLVGQRVLEVFPGFGERFEVHRRVIETGEPFRHVVLEGHTGRWFDTQYVPLGDGIVSVSRDVTDDQAAAEALRESDARFRAAFEDNPMMIGVFRPIFDGSGILEDLEIAFANRQARNAFLNGRPLEAVIGLRMFREGPVGDLFRQDAVQALASRAPVRVERLEPHPAGPRWMESWVVPFVGGLVIFGRDVTETRRALEVLRTASARDRLLVEESADGIIRVEVESGAILDANPAMGEMLGIAHQALIGRRVDDFLAPGQDPLALPEPGASGGPGAMERAFRLPDGRTLTVAIRARALDDGTALASVRDITGERELEQRLRQSQRLEAVGQLAGGVAHDFNNLLTVISGYGELARARIPDHDPAAADLDQVLAAADRAVTLTRQLLAFGRRQVLEPRQLDPAGVVEAVAPMLGRLLGEHIALVVSRGPEVGHVRVDPGQLEQVVTNLAVNARDAMPNGGHLAITIANVDVLRPSVVGGIADATEALVRITVSDTGTGMDPATLARIYEPFFTTKPQGQGTGMGLATVHGIVEQSGGRITCESEPGRGTTFIVDLPRVEAPAVRRTTHVAAEVAAPGPPDREATEPGAHPWTILLVEDEPAIRGYLARVLEQQGFLVQVAESGVQAEGLAARLRPDLLVTDVQMPGMQGPELARRLRLVQPELPVLYVSGYAPDLIDGRLGDMRSTHVIGKPFDGEDLVAAVGVALQGAAR